MTKAINAAEQNYNGTRNGQDRHTLVWLTARNRETGAAESIGFWTGQDDRNFVIGGQVRTYLGAGAALGVDDIPGGVGLDVRYVTAKLGVVPEVADALLGFDPKLGPVEVHTVVFSLETGNLVADPRRIFKGRINETPVRLGGEGGDALFEVAMASSARDLTLTLPLFRSDAETRRRNANDRFRQHVSTSGLRQVAWGERQVRNR